MANEWIKLGAIFGGLVLVDQWLSGGQSAADPFVTMLAGRGQQGGVGAILADNDPSTDEDIGLEPLIAEANLNPGVPLASEPVTTVPITPTSVSSQAGLGTFPTGGGLLVVPVTELVGPAQSLPAGSFTPELEGFTTRDVVNVEIEAGTGLRGVSVQGEREAGTGLLSRPTAVSFVRDRDKDPKPASTSSAKASKTSSRREVEAGTGRVSTRREVEAGTGRVSVI